MPSTDRSPLAVRLTPEQRAWLVREAERRDRSIAYLLRELVAAAMQRQTGEGNRRKA